MRNLKKIAHRIAEIVEDESVEAPRSFDVYCDMDGVLTDLMGKVAEISGTSFDNHMQAMRGLVKVRRNQPEVFEGGKLWANLDWTSNGKQVWQAISSFSPSILTGAIKGVGAGPGKWAWVQRELGLPESRFLMSRTKYEYAHPNAILIDDTSRVINAWVDAGGIGILHQDSSYQNTIQRFNEIIQT